MTLEEKITAVLEKIRPYIQMHGGDVSLSEVRGDAAILRFEGTCSQCQLLTITVNRVVKPMLAEEVPEITKVIFE
ncbi:MAG: NifU family protein [Candidatus Pacebacteria bacterium]|jgi:Fe-S cluster biogenesis protein NfuA|nr:NifU family protein [Candidatus Paceibacterota bacterium]